MGDTVSRAQVADRRTFLKAASAAGVLGALPGNGVAQNQITLEYVDVSGDRTRELFQPVIDDLNDTYDATVELNFREIPYENLQSQLLTRVGAGNPPDVAAIDQIWLGDFIDSGQLMDLSDVADDIDYDDYYPAFREPAVRDGSVYAIPITTDVRGMYWNKDLFEQAGLDPEQPPETWSELYSAAESLHDPPNVYGATFFVAAGTWTVPLFTAGGQVLNEAANEPRFHREPGVTAATFVDDLYNRTPDVSPPQPLYQNGAQMSREFLSGQYAINTVAGSWLDFFWRNMGNTDEEMVQRFGFGPTPHPEGGEATTMSGGFTWAAFGATDYPDVVRDFMRGIGNREFKRRVGVETGRAPTRQSLQDASEIWDQILYSDQIKAMLENTNTRPIQNWSVVSEALGPALQRVAFDRADPEPALQRAAEQVRSQLGGGGGAQNATDGNATAGNESA